MSWHADMRAHAFALELKRKDGMAEETKYEGLPVSGYVAQTDDNVTRVNGNKQLEEQVLRAIDSHAKQASYDQRMVAIARTKTQEAFMWLNRAVFQPTRVTLPGDAAHKE